jgi:hypothetical protein
MNAALEADLTSYSSDAEKLLESWRRNDFDPRSRVLATFKGRLRLTTRNFYGKRLRAGSEERRMMAWRMQEGSLYARLPTKSIEKILSAPGLPIPYIAERHRLVDENRGLSAEELAHEAATMEVDCLWDNLRESQLFPPKHDVLGHTKRLVDCCDEFFELLFHEKTDLMWRTYPASRLAYLRQEFLDFMVVAQTWCNTHNLWHEGRRKLEKTQGRERRSSMDLFISENLRPAYERIYNRPCSITRREGEPPSGPFIAFALAFFEEADFGRCDSRGKKIPYPSAETIAGALKPRPRRPA